MSRSRLYALIQRKQNEAYLEPHLAALALANENNISLTRYSTAEQRAELRNALSGSVRPKVNEHRPAVAENPPVMSFPKTNSSSRRRAPKAKDNSVFVVHGRNDALTKSMFDFLRTLELHPMEWEKVLLATKKTNPDILDAVDKAMAKVQAVVIMFTPDDEARLREELWKKGESAAEKKLRGQARPNVLFEAGLALGLHREKTILVEIGRVRGLSDLAGKHMLRLTNDQAKRTDFANRLELAGCRVDRRGTHWHTTGDFRA